MVIAHQALLTDLDPATEISLGAAGLSRPQRSEFEPFFGEACFAWFFFVSQ
jgi:hypothetical protein